MRADNDDSSILSDSRQVSDILSEKPHSKSIKIDVSNVDSSLNLSVQFTGYQKEEVKPNRTSPAVTFGRGMRRPTERSNESELS